MNTYNLPPLTLVETDPATIAANIITNFETFYYERTGERITLAPADPRRLFLLSIAAVIVQQRNIIEYVAKQNLLAYADGLMLDYLGQLVGVERLPEAYATTTVQFTLSVEQPDVTVIPAGTRVTPGGGNVYFATDEPLEIPPGELTGEISAVCTSAGDIGNGYLAGQINRLVDPLPYVQSVANVTMSEGGADVEDDENYRDRIHMAPESYSTAGPRGAYIAFARSASQLIADVGVYSPEPGVVHLYPLLKNGDLPGPEILARVLEVCNDETVRPLTDHVFAFAPDAEAFDLSVTWYLDRENAAAATSINIAVNSAVAEWLVWQRSKLGRDINPDELIRRMLAAGAKRVVIESPAFRVLEFNQVAVVNEGYQVSFGGMEDG